MRVELNPLLKSVSGKFSDMYFRRFRGSQVLSLNNFHKRDLHSNSVSALSLFEELRNSWKDLDDFDKQKYKDVASKLSFVNSYGREYFLNAYQLFLKLNSIPYLYNGAKINITDFETTGVVIAPVSFRYKSSKYFIFELGKSYSLIYYVVRIVPSSSSFGSNRISKEQINLILFNYSKSSFSLVDAFKNAGFSTALGSFYKYSIEFYNKFGFKFHTQKGVFQFPLKE